MQRGLLPHKYSYILTQWSFPICIILNKRLNIKYILLEEFRGMLIISISIDDNDEDLHQC